MSLPALSHSTSQAGVSRVEETELTIISLSHDSTVRPLKVTQILMSIAYDDCLCRFDLSMACHARTGLLKCVFAYDIF